ncbi:MAG: SUMF1/EgtB/PvdO family nonheme iron enzyme, partial [Pseudomonadota bacterium]
DEVASSEERASVRQAVEDLVDHRNDVQVIVTCRTVAYQGASALASFHQIDVMPLNIEEHVTPMVRRAYECIDAATAQERATNLLDGIKRLEAERRDRLGVDAARLVTSPLMVRLLLVVHVSHKELPDERAELLELAIDTLFKADYAFDVDVANRLRRDWELQREIAQQLAFRMHLSGQDQGRQIDEDEIIRELREYEEFVSHTKDFLRQIRERASVMEERDGMFRFIHLALQEFLAARYLKEVMGDDGLDAILDAITPNVRDPWWREPILLLIGYSGKKSPRTGSKLLDRLAQVGHTATARFAAAELAATGALEWKRCSEERRRSCARRIAELYADPVAILEGAPAVKSRAGNAMAKLGDPRFDPARGYLNDDPLLGFVEIPADPAFVIGTRAVDVARTRSAIDMEIADYEVNDAPVATASFYAAMYPVTVAQFRAFAEDAEFKIEDPEALAGHLNHPIVWVSWYEALKYCRWLTAKLTSGEWEVPGTLKRVLETGGEVTLPSELEWEKMARGGIANRVFPWGNGWDDRRANGVSGFGSSSPV